MTDTCRCRHHTTVRAAAAILTALTVVAVAFAAWTAFPVPFALLIVVAGLAPMAGWLAGYADGRNADQHRGGDQ